MGRFRLLCIIVLPCPAIISSGCFGTPGTTVTNATTAVYTAGATRDTVSARLPKSPPQVYASMNRLIDAEPAVEAMHRNARSYLVEAAWDGRTVTAQATELGPGETLLFLWVDAGDTGVTAREVATSALQRICEDLNVEYKLVEY